MHLIKNNIKEKLNMNKVNVVIKNRPNLIPVVTRKIMVFICNMKHEELMKEYFFKISIIVMSQESCKKILISAKKLTIIFTDIEYLF